MVYIVCKIMNIVFKEQYINCKKISQMEHSNLICCLTWQNTWAFRFILKSLRNATICIIRGAENPLKHCADCCEIKLKQLSNTKKAEVPIQKKKKRKGKRKRKEAEVK